MFGSGRLSRGLSIALLIVLSLFSQHLPAQAKQMDGPMSPAWSPDGKQILMTMVHNEQEWNLSVLDIATGKLTKIADNVGSAAFSTDGKQIVYTGIGIDGVFIANADGSQPRKIASTGYAPTWSPDGKEIRLILYNAIAKVPLGSKQLQRIIEQKGQNMVTYEWSPDQKTIAFSSFADNVVSAAMKIYLMNADGSNLHELEISSSTGDVTWSPDGKYLATVSHCGKKNGLCVWDADGSNPRMVDAYGENPQWSPDSKQIAYVHGGKICLINADGSNAHCLTTDYTGSRPYWSPDGKRLIFTATITEGNSEDFRVITKLNIINADGTGFEQLVP